MIQTLLAANAFAAQAREAGLGTLPIERLSAIRARDDGLIAQGRQVNPIEPGQRTQTNAANLVRRLDVRRDDVLRFRSATALPAATLGCMLGLVHPLREVGWPEASSSSVAQISHPCYSAGEGYPRPGHMAMPHPRASLLRSRSVV